MTRALLGTMLLLLVACSGENGGDAGGSMDGSAADAGTGRDAAGPGFDAGLEPCVFALPVDLLFVIDDSESMSEEQVNLTVNFPELIGALTNPADEDGDGMPDVPAVEDLRIGIISTNMGVGTQTVPGCDATGDGGRLISVSRSPNAACAGVTTGDDPWLEFRTGDDVDALAERFACLAALGTTGCGLEQQLEAARVALTTAAAPGEANEGFLRNDSLVGIVFVTDEDDCSAADDSIYSAAATMTLGPYGTRCAEHPELLHPIADYVSAFSNLRLDRRGDVVVAAITGVPFAGALDPLEQDYDALLMDPRMQFREDEGRPGQLEPACETMFTGSAVPGRRIVEVVRDFAETDDGIATTICDDDLRTALNAIARLVGRRICPPPI